MATTAKKSSTKKPVKKVTKATKPAAAKKPVAKKTTAKKKVVSTPAVSVTKASKAPKTVTPLERLRSINLLSAIVYALFGVLAVVFVNTSRSDLVLTGQVRDTFMGGQQVVLAPAQEVLATVQYKYVLATMLFVSAIGALLLATKLRKTYESGVNYGVSGSRWLLTGLSAGLTLNLVSLLAGITDVMTLKTTFALIFATTLFGWLAERENVGSKDQKWLAFAASMFTGVVAWMPLVGTLVGTTLYGEERYGWHIYALAGAVLLGFIGFAVNQYLSIKKKNILAYTFVEQRYLRIDQLTKFAVVLIIFSALAK